MKIIFLKKILTSDYGFQKYSLEKSYQISIMLQL